MHQTRQTLILVVVAALLAGVAVATYFATTPTPLEGFEKIGTEFYADFDPSEATALRVVSYNADEASISEFKVERKDGLWRVPSHHNYPADAKDQLAKTAASLLGLSREALASRQESDHERFGVISPETDDPSQITGLGQRVAVTDETGKVLADLIIGKEVEDRDGFYYIRRPDEKETYYAKLDIDLSTKFSKWIEQDLLKMDRWNVVKLVATKPGVTPEGQIVDRERVELSRNDTAAQWQLADLNEQTEEVDRAGVDELLRNLDTLEIVGVRPKPPGIGPNLMPELPQSIASNPTARSLFLRELRNDLEARGFFLARGDDDNLRVVSEEGELLAATNEGVVYRLHLGNAFAGTVQEIEFGGSGDAEGGAKNGAESSPQAANGAQTGEAPAANGAGGDTEGAVAAPDAANGESPAAGDDKSQDAGGGKLNRYVYVRVELDPSYIGPVPQQPEEPVKPDGLNDQPAPAAAADSGEAQPADAAGAVAAPVPGADAVSDQAKLQAEYNAAMKQYQASLTEYERKKDDYDRKVKAGQESVDELNRRFRDWYYVISGTSLENLKISRDDLVKPKTADAEAGSATGGSDSATPAPASPGEAAAPAAGNAPATDAPNADAATSDEGQPASPAGESGTNAAPQPGPAQPESAAPAESGQKPPAAPAEAESSENPTGE